MASGDTALFSLVFNNFANLKEKDETVTLLLRSDAQKMSFLFPKNIKIKAVDFDLIHKNRGYRKRICEELFSSHYRLLISTDFLKHPYKDEAIIRGCQADITLGIRHKPWAKYDRALKKTCPYTIDSMIAGQLCKTRWSDGLTSLTG